MVENEQTLTTPAQESKRFEQKGPAVPEGLPERFLKDGKPDFDNLTKSYVELDKAFKKKTEDLLEQVRADMHKDRPEKPESYELPKIEGFDPPADSPLIAWWRTQAHAMGMGQEGFEEGIKQYLDRVSETSDVSKEKEKLGENADKRVEAVKLWAEKTFKDDELKAIQLVGTTAAGVTALEKLMNGNRALDIDDEDATDKDELTFESLREMQSDPRYWNPAKRDREFVRKIEEGYAKLAAKTA